MCVRARAHTQARSQCEPSFSTAFHLSFLNRTSLNLKFTDLARLAGQRWSYLCLSCPRSTGECCHYWLFETWVLVIEIRSSHFEASTLPTKPSLCLKKCIRFKIRKPDLSSSSCTFRQRTLSDICHWCGRLQKGSGSLSLNLPMS